MRPSGSTWSPGSARPRPSPPTARRALAGPGGPGGPGAGQPRTRAADRRAARPDALPGEPPTNPTGLPGLPVMLPDQPWPTLGPGAGERGMGTGPRDSITPDDPADEHYVPPVPPPLPRLDPVDQGRLDRAIRRTPLPADRHRRRVRHLRSRRLPGGRRLRGRLRRPRASDGQRSATRLRARRRCRRLSAPRSAGPAWSALVGGVGVAGVDAVGAGVAGVGVAGCGVAAGGGGGRGLGARGAAGRRGAVGGVRIADSNRLNASLVSPARASAAPATCSLNPAEDPPESLALRAARQIGHHWHSGGSSVGSVVVAVIPHVGVRLRLCRRRSWTSPGPSRPW